MEAKDGSFGFDFAGTYTKVIPNERLEYAFGDRNGEVEFINSTDGVTVRVTFDAESQHPIDQQRQGWQAILNNFAKHVEAGLKMPTTGEQQDVAPHRNHPIPIGHIQ